MLRVALMNAYARLEPAIVDDSRFSVREYVEMMDVGAFADMKVELVEGRLEKVAPAQTRHSRMNGRLYALLLAIFEPLGGDLGIDLAVSIGSRTIRGIDIAAGLRRFSEGVPPAGEVFLAVEIAETTLSRDLGPKAGDYGRAGIPHYWVVDLCASVVHVMGEPGERGYASRHLIRFGERLAVPGTSESITL